MTDFSLFRITALCRQIASLSFGCLTVIMLGIPVFLKSTSVIGPFSLKMAYSSINLWLPYLFFSQQQWYWTKWGNLKNLAIT
jgi:hypothetical protein